MPVLCLPCCKWPCSVDWCEHSTEHHDPLPTVKAKYPLKCPISVSLSTYWIRFLQCLTDSDVNPRHSFFKILSLSLNSVTYVCPSSLALFFLELLVQPLVSVVRAQWNTTALVLFCSRLSWFIHQWINLAHEPFKRRKCDSFHLFHYQRTRR